jgi:lipopolysaccharide export system permease protein
MISSGRPAPIRLCAAPVCGFTVPGLNLLDRYLLREWLKMLALLLVATMGVLMMSALYDDFRDLVEIGAGARDILLYYATLMPSKLSIVLPLSMLLSLLFVLSKLHRNNEIMVVRAAGLNIFAATRALWLAAVVLCGVSLLLNSRVVPWSDEASRSLKETMQISAAAQAAKETARVGAAAPAATSGSTGFLSAVAFDNQRQNRMWFINRYSRFTETAYGVTVSELNRLRREKTRLMAREGRYDAIRRTWTFRDGREMWFDPESGELQRSVAFAEKTVAHYNEDPQLMLLFDRKPSELSFNELGRIVDYFYAEDSPKVTRYQVRYYSMLADTLGPLVILAIAIPFALAGVRVSPAVGVSKSIGLFFLYYILNNFATILGGRGYLDPVWAALMPNLAMIGLAAWLFGRMR